jgi:hypothetical protein
MLAFRWRYSQAANGAIKIKMHANSRMMRMENGTLHSRGRTMPQQKKFDSPIEEAL